MPKAKKIDYIQLESRAYPEDFEWLSMSSYDRGIYGSINIFLGCSGGELPFNVNSLSHLCNCSEDGFGIFWKLYAHKYILKNGRISHKRITEEIKKARKAFKNKSLAGKASANKRATEKQQRCNDATNDEPSKLKKIKEKKKEDYLLKLNKSSSSFFSWMQSEFHIETKRERGTFTKYAKLYAGLCSLDKNFNGRMCGKLMDMKVDTKGDKLQLNKMFIASINNEIGSLKIKELDKHGVE